MYFFRITVNWAFFYPIKRYQRVYDTALPNNLLVPSTHTTSYWRLYNVHNVKTTSNGRQNNVVCVQVYCITFYTKRLFGCQTLIDHIPCNDFHSFLYLVVCLMSLSFKKLLTVSCLCFEDMLWSSNWLIKRYFRLFRLL